MRNKQFFIIGIALCFALTSCKTSNKVNNTGESIEDDKEESVIELSIDTVDISDIENGKTYQTIRYPVLTCKNNELIQKSFDDINEEVKKEAESFKEENKDTIREFIANNSYMGYAEYTHTDDISISRNDHRYLSLIEYIYENTMGAHGMYVQHGYTYSVATGKRLYLYDLIKDRDELRNYLKKWIKDNSDKYMFFDEAERVIDDYIDGKMRLQFYLNDNFVVVLQPYDVAPYAAGLIEIEVDKSLLKVAPYDFQ